MTEMKFTKSQNMLERALKTIPLGSQTFSKSYEQFPQGHSPLFLERGHGARVWDVDGNEYVDLICGLLPILLGYKDPDVDQAIRDQLDRGITFSMATELESIVAEKLVKYIPSAEMVRYGKNGTDATSAAIRLARAHTERDVVLALGYHGWQDWYIGATVRNKGIPKAVCDLTKKLPYNDLDAIRKAFSDHKGNVAAIIMEPMNSADPAPGYLESLKEMAHQNGALFIFDEVITGFRFAKGGAQDLFGVTPDLSCFGKAMGNGMPVSAVVGRADIMMLMNEIFFSSTFGGEALSLAAANAVLDKIEREPVVATIWRRGETLTQAAESAISDAGLSDYISLSGKAPWMIFGYKDHKNGSKEAIKTLVIKEMIARGVLMAGAINVAYALTDDDIARVKTAFAEIFAIVAEELGKPGLNDRLPCPVIRPVFSVR